MRYQPKHSGVALYFQWRKTMLGFAALILLFASLPAAAETQQHRWVGDVPIMNGLKIEPELGFAFDSPNGRIVMIFASSDASAETVLAFYSQSLGQLGWVGTGGSWIRGEERLVVSEVDTARGTLWRLMIQPKS